MRFFEFVDPTTTRLAVLSDHLKSLVDDGEIQDDWTADDLIEFLRDNGFTTGKPDIYDIAKKSALNSVLTINNDMVQFKGHNDQAEADPSQSQKVVQQMAKDAMK
jgi:hypothetical protein